MLAIIPARGGSKRLPRKNILLFNGMPLIYWTIKVAQDSNCFTKIVVSTEDEEIKDISIKYGVEVCDQPEASDTSTAHLIIPYVLNLYPKMDSFMLLQPTSPLRVVKDIKVTYDIIRNTLFPSVVSVVYDEEKDYYVHNGAIYACNINYFNCCNTFYNDESYLYLMPKKRSIDIDTTEDFKEAERLMIENEKRQYLETVGIYVPRWKNG